MMAVGREPRSRPSAAMVLLLGGIDLTSPNDPCSTSSRPLANTPCPAGAPRHPLPAGRHVDQRRDPPPVAGAPGHEVEMGGTPVLDERRPAVVLDPTIQLLDVAPAPPAGGDRV